MHVSRRLVSEIISLTHKFDIVLVCPSSGCNVNSITTALEGAASSDLNDAIENGQLLSELQSNTNGTVSLITGETTLDSDEGQSSGCSCDNSTEVGGSGTTTDSSTSNNSSAWYPAWGATDKCSNAPGMPTYMQGTSHYTSTSLEACCQEHFHWDVTGCISASGGTVSNSGTQEWYIRWETFRCVQSCISDSSSQAQGLNCGGLASTKMLFQNAEDCCTQMVPWVATATCVAESM
ncbi:hypothetical protein THAOC_29858, partial [Thalassiosira oceanica]